MLPEHVDEMLRNYNLCKGKSSHLGIEIRLLRKRLDALSGMAIDDAAAGSAVQYDGMPHSAGISDHTGRIAISFADGFKPQYIVEGEAELNALEQEKCAADATVLFVQSWLQSLSEKERYVITRKMIDGATWPQLAKEFGDKFGSAYSKEGVKRIRDRAMNKIYLMAS